MMPFYPLACRNNFTAVIAQTNEISVPFLLEFSSSLTTGDAPIRSKTTDPSIHPAAIIHE